VWLSAESRYARLLSAFWHFGFGVLALGLACPQSQMNTLHKYLIRQVLASLLLGMAVFTFVLLIGDGLKEILPLLIDGQVQLGVVLEAIGLLIPFIWVYALPMGLLTATLLVFGRFSADQELTAARAGGISLLSLVTPVLLLSLFCCGLSAWINLDLGPRSRVAFKELLFQARADLAHFQLPEKQFIRDIPGYIIYVDKNDRGDLQDVMVFVLQHETNVTTTIRAPEGRLKTDLQNKQLVFDLLNPQMVTLMPNDRVRIDSSKGWASYIIPLSSMENHPYHPAISDMTFGQLRNELDDLNQKLSLPPDLDATTASDTRLGSVDEVEKQRADLTEPIRVEMHRQIAFSFACFSFTLIGIPLGIRVHRRETNVGVAIALVLVLVYYAFVMLGESLSARAEFAPHLIFWLPNFIFQAIGAVLLWRANRGI
jgi:lipopolysaccharide export system permease protein